jgi:hypothetical protein
MKQFLLAAFAVAVVAGSASAQGKQTKCPVMKEELGSKPTAVAYTGKNKAYKGKSVMVCCPGCSGAIKKDPDKYFAMVHKTK